MTLGGSMRGVFGVRCVDRVRAGVGLRMVASHRPSLRRIPIVAVFFAVTVLVTTAAIGQEALPSERSFFAPVVVSVVNVEVFATDAKGRPVAGLTADDFEILEDGEPLPISNFYAARGVVPEWLDVERPATPEEEADQDLYLVVCLLDSHLAPRSRQRMIDALGELKKDL